MTTKVEDLGSNKIRIEIQVPAERYEKELDAAYHKLKGDFVVPGFRKGKAPRAVIESRFGSDVFAEEAIDELFKSVYPEALDEIEQVVVSAPEDVNIEQMDPVAGVTFSVVTYRMPDVNLGEWKGLHADRIHHKVTDQMVEDEVHDLATENTRWVEVDRAAENGDMVNIDFVGKLNGEPFEGGSAQNHSLVLGSDSFVAGFEKQIEGMKPGEDRDITVRFPAKYHAQELAGKDVVFSIHLHQVRSEEFPTLDDEFAQDVSEFDTMEALRASIRERLEARAEELAQINADNDLVAQVAEASEVEIPKPMVDYEFNMNLREMERYLMPLRMSVKDYLESQDLSIQQLYDVQAPKIESEIKMQLVVDALIKATGAEATDALCDARITELAQAADTPVEDYRNAMTDRQKESIARSIEVDEMLKRLEEHAVIEDKEAEPEPEPEEMAEESHIIV